MDTLVPHLKQTLRGMWQGRWIGLAVAWLAGVAGAAYIISTPDRYEASARVYVDTQSVLQPLLSGLTVQPNVEQEVAILSRTLISRPNLQKLVRMTDMDLRVKTPEEREALIDHLMRKLFIRSVGRDNLYTIGFTHEQPAQAGRVVQGLLSIFVESGLTGKTNDTGQAKRFIAEQIKVYEQRLAEAENRVKEFKLQNMDLNGPDGSDFFGGMAKGFEQLREARLSLQEAERSRDALKQTIADEERQAAAAPAPAEAPVQVSTPELDERIRILSKNLDEMLLRYTDGHPDVLNTRRIIKEVEEQRADERKRLTQEMEKQRLARGAGGAATSTNSQMKFALAEADAQVAALRARVADFERRLAVLRSKARSVPEREAQFAQLNRDYAIQKQSYENLVSRRETANISGEMGAATGFADFRVIDPPRVSPDPVAPDRKMLIPLVLLAALGAGLGASYLFSLVHPTFHDNRSLKRVGQRPVLGAVSLMASAATRRQRRRSRMLFFGGLGGLAVTYGSAIAVVFLRGLLPF
jgi:polysaccharide chain length determinant protein (PEP-CTERM system associated)